MKVVVSIATVALGGSLLAIGRRCVCRPLRYVMPLLTAGRQVTIICGRRTSLAQIVAARAVIAVFGAASSRVCGRMDFLLQGQVHGVIRSADQRGTIMTSRTLGRGLEVGSGPAL